MSLASKHWWSTIRYVTATTLLAPFNAAFVPALFAFTCCTFPKFRGKSRSGGFTSTALLASIVVSMLPAQTLCPICKMCIRKAILPRTMSRTTLLTLLALRYHAPARYRYVAACTIPKIEKCVWKKLVNKLLNNKQMETHRISLA